ncbi:MAG: DNA (cytosine-5-)-methyltransferase [Oscillospiraceae bacterium]
MERELTHLSLFSGIGGLDLAAEWAGFRTVGQCEWADYQRAVLEKHWPGLPRWRDIRTLTKESFYEQTGLYTVDVISGGFPCQPFSVAGKQRGKDDDRYLWPEFIRVIRELWPTWVIGENVPGIINMALDTVLSDLEAEGYEVQCFLVPACGVDAPHKRNRICIVAHRYRNCSWKDEIQPGREASEYGLLREIWNSCTESGVCRMDDGLRGTVYETDSHTDSDGLQGRMSESVLEAGFTNCPSRERERETGVRRSTPELSRSFSVWENWPDEPGVGRVAHGFPNRVDRIKCLGNAVVPQQFYPFFMAIAEIERRSDVK